MAPPAGLVTGSGPFRTREFSCPGHAVLALSVAEPVAPAAEDEALTGVVGDPVGSALRRLAPELRQVLRRRRPPGPDHPSHRAARRSRGVVQHAVGPGLAGADIDLDRTSALRWPPRRAAHLVAAAAVAVGLLAFGNLLGGHVTDTERIARDTVGLTGLVGLGAATVGSDRARPLPLAWTAVVIAHGPATGSTLLQALTWIMQPPGSTTAWVTAGVLGMSGAVTYAVLGARS